MARRGDNIHKRKDGRWEGRYKDGYRADGSVKYSSVYAYSYSECKKKLTDAQSSTSKTTNKIRKISVCIYLRIQSVYQLQFEVLLLTHHDNL